jgi:hypothetical protein
MPFFDIPKEPVIVNLDGELWKDIPEYPGYQVSNLGRVKSLGGFKRAGHGHRFWPILLLKTKPDKLGYIRAYLARDGKSRFCLVHYLVLTAFVGPKPLGMETCHKNDVRSDNRLENLYWGTRKDNVADARRNGRYERQSQRMKGGRTYQKLTPDQVRKIRSEYQYGVKGFGHIALAKKYGVAPETIRAIVIGTNWSSLK